MPSSSRARHFCNSSDDPCLKISNAQNHSEFGFGDPFEDEVLVVFVKEMALLQVEVRATAIERKKVVSFFL
jgi:hypothetical protein